jgi:hypothetical protein
MYYTTSGAYRKSKMLIDYANIALTFAIGIVFIIILFLRSGSGILFAVEFFLGALVNGLTAAKNFMSDRTVSGVILTVVTLGHQLYGMSQCTHQIFLNSQVLTVLTYRLLWHP